MCSRRLGRTLLAGLSVLLLGGCSVREDRSGCPCLLILDFSQPAAEAGVQDWEEVIWSVRSADYLARDRIPSDALPPEYVVEAPRSPLELTVVSGDDGLFDPTAGLRIPEGEACPPVYGFAAAFDGVQMEIPVPVVLHKRYVLLDMRLRDWEQAGLRWSVNGCVCGYGPALEPLHGSFRVALSPDAEGRCAVSLPPQEDGTLTLCAWRYGELERVFAIGQYILDSGYDWRAPDLADISLEIDYVDGSARIKIDQWSKTLYFTIAV